VVVISSFHPFIYYNDGVVKSLNLKQINLAGYLLSGVETNMNQGGILSGKAIELAVSSKEILIDRFDPKYLNPASYDLTLGREVRIYSDLVDIHTLKPFGKEGGVLDSRECNPTKSFGLNDEGLTLYPGVGYLMHTEERVGTQRYVPVLDGKSSLARLFIQIHSTAGYGDPNFFGQYTLEVLVQHPVRVYPGMRIAQIRFHTLVGEPVMYQGNYIGENARGAVPSRSWNQF
jgi:dCTP deaminase